MKQRTIADMTDAEVRALHWIFRHADANLGDPKKWDHELIWCALNFAIALCNHARGDGTAFDVGVIERAIPVFGLEGTLRFDG